MRKGHGPMKTSSPFTRFALCCASLFLALPAFGGAVVGTLQAEFNTADADTSGSLSELER